MATPDAGVDADELLRRLFSGRRSYPRCPLSIEATVTFPHLPRKGFGSRSVDVSRGGILLAITDPEFNLSDGLALAEEYGTKATHEDSFGVRIAFARTLLRLRSEVVRVVLGPNSQWALGLRFSHVLTLEEARVLAIPMAAGDQIPDAETPEAEGHPQPQEDVKRAAGGR